MLKKICGINNLESTTMENYLLGKLGKKKEKKFLRMSLEFGSNK
jgi:hypothetical protein